MSLVDKDWNKVKTKFALIYKDVSLFEACYKISADLEESGTSDDDRLAEAHALFFKKWNQEPTNSYAFKY